MPLYAFCYSSSGEIILCIFMEILYKKGSKSKVTVYVASGKGLALRIRVDSGVALSVLLGSFAMLQ